MAAGITEAIHGRILWIPSGKKFSKELPNEYFPKIVYGNLNGIDYG